VCGLVCGGGIGQEEDGYECGCPFEGVDAAAGGVRECVFVWLPVWIVDGMNSGARIEQPTFLLWSGAATSQSSVDRKPEKDMPSDGPVPPVAGEVEFSTIHFAEVCRVTALES
jgi:hypothetical protein